MKKKLGKVYEFYLEKLINLSDIDYTHISNERAKKILGQYWRLSSYLKVVVINEMVDAGLLERENQKVLIIKSSALE